MAKAKKEKEETLENILWNCRVALRNVGTMEKNRDAVISLVFLKFASDKFYKRQEEIKEEYKDKTPLLAVMLENPNSYSAKNVFYLDEKARWQYIKDNASADDIAEKIDEAIAKVVEMNKLLEGAFPTNSYSSLGASTSNFKALINEISKIDESRFHEQDLIGRVYEYFLQSFAAAGTKEDGEFYTPACCVKLIAELIEPYKGIVYDPCCGTGGMFVQSTKFVENHNGNKLDISIRGQEKKQDTWRLAKLNLAVRGISYNLGETYGSTFDNDQHKDIKVDYIMANPPFNLKNWREENTLTTDSRWQGYGVPMVSNANYAWILHMISKLDVNHGIAGFLLANGALNDKDEITIRKNIIKKDKIEAIIVLPRDMFYTTDISVTLWILNMNKKAGTVNGRKLRDRRGEILFVDLRTWDKNIQEIKLEKGSKKKTILTDEQIAEVKKIYNNWQSADTSLYHNVEELCQSVTIDNIKNEGKENVEISEDDSTWPLTPSNYIKFVDHDLDIDYKKEMSRIQKEMKEVVKQEKESQALLEKAFKGIGYGID